MPKDPTPTEQPANAKRRAKRLFDKLDSLYPDAHCALDHRNAYELLAATILSAQCTDERVNLTTPALFQNYPTPGALAGATQRDVERLVQSCGFYRNKAKNLIGMARGLVDDHGGEVPREMDALLALPGVARKTANVVLGNAFGINRGVVVDTHVGRLSVRLGWTGHDSKAAVPIERDLMGLFPRRTWTQLPHLLIYHGRQVCKAQRPACDGCALRRSCPRVGVEAPE